MCMERPLTAQPEIGTRQLVSVRAAAASLNFHPRGTIRCNGVPLFRNQLARDLGCLLDVDRDVLSWSCLPMALSVRHAVHTPDFLVCRADGQVMVDAVSTPSDCASALVEAAASREEHGYETMSSQQSILDFGW